MADVYDECIGGSLRLKGALGGGGVKKKKKKKNKAKEVLEAVEKSEGKSSEGTSKSRSKKTPAELAFIKTQEKRRAEKIIEKAKKTHKQRVEEFNAHLDQLSEHYDIPKVSWTK